MKQVPARLMWLQCGRALAACSVVLYHGAERVSTALKADSEHFLGGAFKHGANGVDLFFVISGFIIVSVHLADIGRPERLARYAYRRVTRIYPLYWILFLLVAPLYFLFPAAGEGFVRDPGHLLANFLLLPAPPRSIIGVAWTLILEMGFYVMFGLMIWNRRVGIALFALWASLVAANFIFQFAPNYVVGTYLSRHYLEFFAGMAVAMSYRRTPYWLGLSLAATIGWLFVLVPLASPGPKLEILGVGAGAAALILGLVSLDRAGIAAPRWLAFLGNASYSIYLFHWVVGWVLGAALSKLHLYHAAPPVLVFAGLTTAMLLGGVVGYLLIERPTLNWFHGRWTARESRMAASDSAMAHTSAEA